MKNRAVTGFGFVGPIAFHVALLLVFLLFGCSTEHHASADDHHPIVPAYQRFIDVEEIGDAERGQLLLNELNCLSCHVAKKATWSVAPKQAPILTDVGSRIVPEHFENFLLAPHSIKPGTTMPDVLAGKPDDEKKKIAESIAHFLATTGQPMKQSPSSKLVLKGEKLFHSVGCVACHDPQNTDAKSPTAIATSIPLGKLHEKYSLSGLASFIENPMHARPSGRMPQFDLKSEEIQAIASFLFRDADQSSKINYTYYEGKWEKLPNFSQLKPVKSGTSIGFALGMGRPDGFGVVFEGFWTTTEETEYTFFLSSDDGSKLIIDDEVIVVNDGIHGVATVNATKTIPSGIHKVRVEFFEGAGGEELRVEVSGGNLKRVMLDALLRNTENEIETKDKPVFKQDLDKAKIGRTYFQSVGCASCHELKTDNVILTSTYVHKAKPLADLKPAGGCLTGEGNGPSFGLTENQVKSIVAGIERIKNPPTDTADPKQLVHEKLATLNCYACHNRQQEKGLVFGGVVDTVGDSFEVYGRKNWFTSTQAEMGDEGQHPPTLTSVGSKLNPKWLDHVLANGANNRPYMLTRMPKYGVENLGKLAEELKLVDALRDIPVVKQTESLSDLKSHGRYFAGEDGLSCIKCHTFGKYKATGIQAIDLTTMGERLNRDWFRAYMLKPSKFRRGTRMPESWPGGKSFFPDILEGDTNKQIDAIWEFLADGKKAAKPKGLIRSKMELKAVDAPKMYRNFIEGAGARAIGVGYPEQVNLAFDAENCRLALIWQENFIDASRHWTGRGIGFEAPLGEKVLSLPDSIVFAKSLDGDVWPSDLSKHKPQFKGYRFDADRRPIFKYQLDDLTFEDQPVPKIDDERPLLNRKIKISSTKTTTIHYLVAKNLADNSEKIALEGNKAVVDGGLKLSFSGPVALSINKRGELIATITLTNGEAEIEQNYDW